MKRVQPIFLIIVLCTGCSTHVKPWVSSEDTFEIAEFTTSSPVTVINAQLATTAIKIGSSGTGMGQIPKTVYGNLHEWTEKACHILIKELQARTVLTTGETPKIIRLTITQVSVKPVAFLGGNTIKVHVTVESDDGIFKDFDVEYTKVSRRQIEKNAGGALVKTIATILNDDAIQNYLQN